MSEINTYSTSSGTMDVSPIVLHETGSTRLLFYPRWVDASENHLRGGFRFEKKSRNETWQEFKGRSITRLHTNEVYELNLSGEDMAKLFSNLESIKTLLEKWGYQYGNATFTLADDNTKGVLLQIGDSANRDLIVRKLRELEANNFSSIENAVATAKLQTAIDTIRENLANSGEDFWQEYFDNNSWIIQQIFHFPLYYMKGQTYVGGKNTNNQGGVIADQLFRNGVNNSFAVVEIKPPTKPLVGGQYRGDGVGSENICHSMSGELTGALVQLENQIRVATSEFRSMVGSDFPELNQIDPVGLLLIGHRAPTMDDDKKRSFSLFRKTISKSIVMTYDGLLDRLEIIKRVYSE